MANITVSISAELCEKMKKHSEVKWSEVVRRALASYVDRLEIVEGGMIPMKKIAKKLKDAGIDITSIDLDRAVEFYEDGRLSSAQTS
jgi:hypothetical protein